MAEHRCLVLLDLVLGHAGHLKALAGDDISRVTDRKDVPRRDTPRDTLTFRQVHL
jgi:hypothetical protein